VTLRSEELVARAARVRLCVLDVDGVLTDGTLSYTAEGESEKRFHVHDGLGIRLLRESGIEVAVVSGRSSPALERRLRDLCIRHVRLGEQDKRAAVEHLSQKLGIGLEEMCFAGDDALDLPAMRVVGLSIAVPNAHSRTLAAADWVTDKAGGAGAVREIADALLEARGALDAAYERLAPSRPRASAGADVTDGFGIIIPARYGASRLPGKPLAPLAGRPLVLHVLDQAQRAGASFVVVATDDERIASAVRQDGGDAVMTSADHETGTDRLAEVVNLRGLLDSAIVVNVQGDEPLVDPKLIAQVAETLRTRTDADVATLATPIRDVEHLFDPNVVKVVVGQSGLAVGFSRAPIPWVRGVFSSGQRPLHLPEGTAFLRHIGLYAYRVGALRKITAQAPTTLERAEALEQLRTMWMGMAIHVDVVDTAPAHGVDCPADLAEAEEMLRRRAMEHRERPRRNQAAE